MRRARGFFVLAVLLMTVAGFGESQYWKGNDRFNRHDYRGAIEAYSKAILKDPTNFAALLHRGTSHEFLEEYDEALADYDRAIALVPSFGVAFHYRGHVHSKLGKPELAIADYDSALIWAHAVAVDQHGIMIKVDKASAYYDRGNAYRRLGRLEASIASYDSSIMLAPKFAAPYNNRGLSRKDSGDIVAACRDGSKACELGSAVSCEWVRDSCGTK